MSMGPGDEIRVPLRIDTSQVEADLRAIDKELARLEQRVIRTFNRTVANQGTGQATKLSDVRAFLGQSGPLAAATLGASPELARALRSLEQREQAIARQAAAGRTSLPATERQEALARLRQVERGGGAAARPTEITARAEFFDRMRQSLLRGLSNAPAMAAAQTGIPGASGLARTLMGLAGESPLLAGGLGAAVAVGAGAIAVDAERARFQRQQASLASALVGGPAFGEQRTMLGLGVMAAAQQMSASKEEGGAIAYQLASAGMRPGQVTKNMQNVLGMTGGYGLQAGDVEPLVAALGTAGGMSASQIKQTLSDVVDASGSATGSIQQLTQGLGALSAVNAAAARDAYGLAAVQRAVGPTSGINAGALMAPAMGAFGTQALGLAGLLGISPERLTQMQRSKGGQAQLYDLAAGFMRGMPHDVTGQELGLQILSDVGGIDVSRLPADQKLRQAQRMQAARPGQAYADYQRSIRAPRPRRPAPAELARHNKSAWDQFWLSFGNMLTLGANDPQHEGGTALSARSRALGMTGPVPTAPGARPGGGGGAATADVAHTLNVRVTVQDQRGRELAHAVDRTRVVTGARSTLRPPYDRPGALDTPAGLIPGRWNEGWG